MMSPLRYMCLLVRWVSSTEGSVGSDETGLENELDTLIPGVHVQKDKRKNLLLEPV